MVPDYSQPPPYSTQPAPVQEGKRRSHGGDSKYGFPNKGGAAVEELPPPPPTASNGYSSGNFRSPDRYSSLPAEGASPPDKRSQSQPAAATQGKGKKDAPGPVLPPKIDRQKKPSKKSAAERLFGRGGEKEEKRESKENQNVTNGETAVGSDESPVEKRSNGYDSMGPKQEPASKKNTFDSNSSGNFDSYNKHAGDVPGYAYSRSISQPPAPHYAGPRAAPLWPPTLRGAEEEGRTETGTATTSPYLPPSPVSTSLFLHPSPSRSVDPTASLRA